MGQRRLRLLGSFMGVSGKSPGFGLASLTTAIVDFEKTFIQCIVYNYETLKEYKDEASLRAAGKVMTKGKDYGEHRSVNNLTLLDTLLEHMLIPSASCYRWRYNTEYAYLYLRIICHNS